MRDIVAKFSKKLTNDVDSKLFDREEENSIASYIISGIKVIESLDCIKFIGYEHITDASKMDLKINRHHIKSKAILNDKEIERIIPIRETAKEMLVLKFRIEYNDEVRYVTKNLFIPAYIDRYHMLINGKEVLPQKQIVDMSTYSQKNSIKLKTTLTPIDIYKKPIKGLFESTDEHGFSLKTFILNLFNHEINPLYYFAARFAVRDTIRYFGLTDIIDITDKEYDRSIFYYFAINKEMFVEVDKRIFDESTFIKIFTYMIYDLFVKKDKFDCVDNGDFWKVRLGSMFTSNTKLQLSKGKKVLISFERTLDDITKRTLRLGKRNLESSYSLIRWMIGNFSELRKKDNHDMELKRIRCNEVTAFYFFERMAYRVNTLLNKKNVTIESIEKIFNWNPDELIKSLVSAKNSILKYDPDINNFELLQALRITRLGKQGISGGKNISFEFRDIYPSQLGRLDLNGISHGKNTALTGFITPRCKVYGEGFFSKESSDPDGYFDYIKDLSKEFYSESIEAKKTQYRAEKLKKLKSYKQLAELDTWKTRNGVFIIPGRSKTYIDYQTGCALIAPRNPSFDYVPHNISSDGFIMDDKNVAIIPSRHQPDVKNGVYIVSGRIKKTDTDG